MLEIRLRTFFTSDEADFSPSVAAVVDPATFKDGAIPDWTKVVEGLRATALDAVKDAPLTNIREMTKEEIAAYRKSEEE